MNSNISTVSKTIHILLPPTCTTPSSLASIPPSMERLHRIHGISLLNDASNLLRVSPSTFATSSTIFHRFYHGESLTRHDVWTVAMASLLLASKVEEDPRSIRCIILTFCHVYRRRKMRVNDDVARYSYGAADAEGCNAVATEGEKENLLRHVPPMSMGGAIYDEWKKALVEGENFILRTLGFTLFWISEGHPHRFILYFVRVLEIEDREAIQKTWNYCNDSCHLDLCVRFDAETIASASILMACIIHRIDLPYIPRPWWEVFIGPHRESDLSNVCNAILAVGDDFDLEVRRAKYAFVPSLLEEASFNDPESYLWSAAN